MDAPTGLDTALDSLARRLDATLEGVAEHELRLLLVDILGRSHRAACGLRVELSVNALTACAATGVQFVTPADYELWRCEQPRSDEWPSSRFIRRCFDDRWSAGLDGAGLPVKPGRRIQQLTPAVGGYTRAELLAALRSWLAANEDADPTFPRYRAWAQGEMAARRRDRLPISASTFRATFGSWAKAVAAAGCNLDDHGRNVPRDVRRAYERAYLLDQLRRASEHTGMGAALTRSAHDSWLRQARARRDGYRPAHSETIRRRFGSWKQALRAAGLDTRRERGAASTPLTTNAELESAG